MTASQERRPTWKPAWVVVWGLTIGLIALTLVQTLDRYHAFRSGWSWDLAYYNQWYWSLLFGNRTLTVRPIAAYATEGPSVWQMNYVSPLRFLLVPLYYLAPQPRTLLVVHGVLFWLVVPAAFTLVRSETRSDVVALSAATLVPLTPLLWPLAWNDFRELQLCLPYVLWGVQGVRSRNVWLTVLAIAGMFACRQEMAVVAATFAILPAREAEDLGRTLRWGRGLLVCGLLWSLVFVLYLRCVVASNAPEFYIGQFTGPKAALLETLKTGSAILFVGMGAWAVLMMFTPRVALLALPWLWGLASGKWALRFLETVQWHEVRYTVPFVATALAAGLVGYSRVASWLLSRTRGLPWLVGIWVASSVGSVLALGLILEMLAREPVPMASREVAAVWSWIDQVGPEDGVLAIYEVTAPLSSRRLLYSDVLVINQPPHYPKLPPTIRWVFHHTGDPRINLFVSQGFRVVHKGNYLMILRRDDSSE